MPSPRLFVSHSHNDTTWCNEFVTALKNLGFDVWYDRDGLFVGSQWVKRLEQEIQGREVFIIVLTPDAWASQWVQSELSLALGQHKHIIGVMCKTTQVQGFLTTYQLLDSTRMNAKQGADAVAAALKGAKPSPARQPPTQPPTQTPATPSTDIVRGEWVSDGISEKIELLLNQYQERVQRVDASGYEKLTTITSIRGTGDHWICGKVNVVGEISDKGITLTLTPIGKSPLTRVELNLTLLPSGVLKGLEIQYGIPASLFNQMFNTLKVLSTRNITFSPSGR